MLEYIAFAARRTEAIEDASRRGFRRKRGDVGVSLQFSSTHLVGPFGGGVWGSFYARKRTVALRFTMAFSLVLLTQWWHQ